MIDNVITIALGILVALMGFGKVRLSKNDEKNREYLDKYGMILRIGGIVLIVIGAFLAIANVLSR